MGITIVELIKAKVREVEDVDRQLAHLTRRRESLAEEIAAIRESVGATVTSALTMERTVPSAVGAHLRVDALRDATPGRLAHASELLAHSRLVHRALTAEPSLRLGTIAARAGLTVARAKYVIETMRQRGWVTTSGVRSATRYTAALAIPTHDADAVSRKPVDFRCLFNKLTASVNMRMRLSYYGAYRRHARPAMGRRSPRKGETSWPSRTPSYRRPVHASTRATSRATTHVPCCAPGVGRTARWTWEGGRTATWSPSRRPCRMSRATLPAPSLT